MHTKTDTASSPLVEDIRVAMRKAFHFGQTYWQQADSESVSQNSKSDETSRKFKQLVADTCTALAVGIAQPAAQGPTEQAGELPPLPDGILTPIPLVEPVYIAKALLAHREAHVVLDKGIGPIAAVHLVNIGLTGWTHNAETAAAFAKGYNTALDQYRAALAARQAPASTLTQSRDRALWTDEQRENHRKNQALVYRCTVCCARAGEPHLPSCSEQGICGVSTQDT